ncbi:MAG: TonB-dependent receptor [Desulfobacteraceae bacterium]|nr:TonB-dependent receptor [Desulfobacteraceae bacterium]
MDTDEHGFCVCMHNAGARSEIFRYSETLKVCAWLILYHIRKYKYGSVDWQLAYCYQYPKDADTDEELPYVPKNRITGKLNYEISKYLNAHPDVLWTGSRSRLSGDDRGDMSSYATLNLSMIARNFYKGFEIRGTIYNLFDEDYEDPDASGASQLIMEDYPKAGISGLLEVSYKF